MRLHEPLRKSSLRVSDDCTIDEIMTKYEMCFEYHSEALIMSLISSSIFLGCTITDNFRKVTFNAESVELVTSILPMSLELMNKMIYDLSIQLKYLLDKCGKCFIGYSIKNIILIGRNRFVYIPNNEDILDVVKKDLMLVTYPFSLGDFVQSPETMNISKVPMEISVKSIYYSLSSLVLDCLSNEKHSESVSRLELTERNEGLLDRFVVKETKLYYLLRRGLSKEVDSRWWVYL